MAESARRAASPAAEVEEGEGQKAQAAESTPINIRVREIHRSGGGYDATIIQAGLGDQTDRNYYDTERLCEAVERGLFDGLRCSTVAARKACASSRASSSRPTATVLVAATRACSAQIAASGSRVAVHKF
jgi:hypothetical protein